MKQIKYTGLVVFGLLMIAAGLLYKERVLYADSAYYAFNLINNGVPAAEHNRYALYLYQFIPWVMLKMNCTTDSILIAFSVCHVLVHAIVFLIILKLEQPRLAALLLVLQVFGIRECYFLTVNETALAISFTLLLAALVTYFKHHQASILKQGLLYFTCIAIALFSHPMAVILLLFVFGFYLLSDDSAGHRKLTSLQLGISFLLVLLLKKIVSRDSGYEDDLYAQLHHTFQILKYPGDVYSVNFFLGDLHWESYFFYMYCIPLILFCVGLFRLYKMGRLKLMLFYFLSVVGFWWLIVIFFNRGDSNIFMEKDFLPWIVIALYPLVDLVKLNEGRLPRKVFITMLLIIAYSIYGINQVKAPFMRRVQLMDELITSRNPQKASKLLLQDSCINYREWMITWTLPYETLLLSRAKGIPNVSARIYKNEEAINKELYRKDIFLGADFMSVLPAKDLLNQKYFELREEVYTKVDCK